MSKYTLDGWGADLEGFDVPGDVAQTAESIVPAADGRSTNEFWAATWRYHRENLAQLMHDVLTDSTGTPPDERSYEMADYLLAYRQEILRRIEAETSAAPAEEEPEEDDEETD